MGASWLWVLPGSRAGAGAVGVATGGVRRASVHDLVSLPSPGKDKVRQPYSAKGCRGSEVPLVLLNGPLTVGGGEASSPVWPPPLSRWRARCPTRLPGTPPQLVERFFRLTSSLSTSWHKCDHATGLGRGTWEAVVVAAPFGVPCQWPTSCSPASWAASGRLPRRQPPGEQVPEVVPPCCATRQRAVQG